MQFPNRYRLQLVPGTDDIYDLTPAPGTVTDEGTFVNKTTLLKDSTAALFGFTEDQWPEMVPDDVLNWLGTYNTHWWRFRENRDLDAEYIEKRSGATSNSPSSASAYESYFFVNCVTAQSQTTTVKYADRISIDQSTGAVSLADPSEVTIKFSEHHTGSGLSTLNLSLRGKYVQNVFGDSDSVYYFSDNISFSMVTGVGSYTYCWVVSLSTVSVVSSEIYTGQFIGTWKYLQSADLNAYPDSGLADGYEYQYLGVPFDNAVGAPKIETGSYVGTGTYGAANPNSLTFSFAPKLVWIHSMTNRPTDVAQSRTGLSLIFTPEMNGLFSTDSSDARYSWISQLSNRSLASVLWSNSGRTVSWYSLNAGTGAADNGQANQQDYTYHYIAIG